MKMKKIPTYIDYDTGTVFIQSKRTGKMQGRKKTRGFGDRTAVRRLRKNYNSYEAGQILGRTPSIDRETLVKAHKRRDKRTGHPKSIRSHFRNV